MNVELQKSLNKYIGIGVEFSNAFWSGVLPQQILDETLTYLDYYIQTPDATSAATVYIFFVYVLSFYINFTN